MLFTYLFPRCNPDDPQAEKGYRPRINRASVKKLLGGSKEGVLDAANDAEDDLSKRFAEANVNDKDKDKNNNNNNNNNCLLYTSPSPRD